MDGSAELQDRNTSRSRAWRIAGSRRTLSLTLLAMAGLLASQTPIASGVRDAAAAGNQFATTGQTAAAFAGSFDFSSGLNVYVSVFQWGSKTDLQTMLSYDIGISNPDGSFTDLEDGFGPIPNADVQVTGGARPTAVTLNTDTSASANPNLYRIAGSGGIISVTWAATPFFSNLSSGTNQGRMGRQITFQSSGSRYETSAMPTGTVIGRTLTSGPNSASYGNLDFFQGITVCRACS